MNIAYNRDCLEAMREMEDNSIDCIITDPPYYKVKRDAWDNAWSDPAKFIEWIGELCEQWQRILKPNGSLYCFASPKMSARVECEIGKWFSVLNCIRWVKEAGWHNKTEKEALRGFLSPFESIIFAEHFNADNIAKGEAGYQKKCDELRGFLFEPLRAYIEDETKRAGVSKEDVNEALGFRRQGGMASRHYYSQSQFCLPTKEHYAKMQIALSNLDHGGQYLQRPYEELRTQYEELRTQYEELRTQYEELRRPFNVSADVPYTDVWTFPTVSNYKGKHPCEKPLAMMEHIVNASTRERQTVLDCFMGSGVVGEACRNLGRNFIGIEKDPDYFEAAKRRIDGTPNLFNPQEKDAAVRSATT